MNEAVKPTVVLGEKWPKSVIATVLVLLLLGIAMAFLSGPEAPENEPASLQASPSFGSVPSGTYKCAGDSYTFSGSGVTGNIDLSQQTLPFRAVQHEDYQELMVTVRPGTESGMFIWHNGTLSKVTDQLYICTK